MALRMPPELPGRGPTLSTMHEIEVILRRAQTPLSLNEVKRRMSAKTVPHRTVRAVIDEFQRLGLAVEGSKGVVWTLSTDDQAWARARHTKLA